jgi:predicted metalloprotease with PDZ domain
MNSGVSYYLKGELVALCLDLAIRDRTKGKRSLDDVMRALYVKYPLEGKGIPEKHAQGVDGWRETLEEVTGLSWRTFWGKYIEGTDEVDLEKFLKSVGWRLEPVHLDSDPQKKEPVGDYYGPGAWLGAQFKDHERGVKVLYVLVSSPAIAAGLAADDEIVAIDGMRVNGKEWIEKRLHERLPGDFVTLHFFRRGELVEKRIMLGENPPEKWRVESIEGAPALSKTMREAWLAPVAAPKNTAKHRRAKTRA